MKDVIGNCFLCGEHTLHVAGTEESQVMQCIACGYTTATKYMGSKEENEEYKKLTDEMKKWSKWENNRIWIPTVMTLPMGMLYPMDDENGEMKWAWASMTEISEEEKENYPNPDGGFYQKRIDTDNPKVFDEFFESLNFVNEMLKTETK
tara:strand:+ start:338 stop:784 length:447 start_codon:yes stop_codon:yes gene_type:complete